MTDGPTADLATVLLPELDRRFAGALARLGDDEFGGSTALPGWTRAHVVAHVHANALALCRLVGWARTGVPAAMYDSAEHRVTEIDRLAGETPSELRAMVAASATRFAAEFGDLTAEQRDAVVVTAQGRNVPAHELAWMRCRELGVHTVDLDAGTGFDDLPPEFVAALVDEVVARRVGAGEGPALAAWLTGRHADPLGRWI